MAILHALYSIGLTALLVAYAPVALWRRVVRGVPLHLRERFGFYRNGPVREPAAWIHSVSVGETLAAVPLVAALRQRYPSVPIVLTTVTATGAGVAVSRLAGAVIHRFFPLDLPGPVSRAIRANRPRFAIVMETELWPNLLRALARRRIPVMLANGRLSDRSFRRYRRLGRLMHGLLSAVSVFGMRSIEDSRRIIALGADPDRVFVTGDIKHDSSRDDGAGPVDWRAALEIARDAPVWIAGSTHHGEEEIVLAVHERARAAHPGLVLILAPRHPERVDDVVRLARARGHAVVRRSRLPGRGDATILLDTVGELAGLYEIADVVFVGGSLVAAGGHNVIEPALRRKPVLFGPHTANFRESTALLLERGGGGLVDGAGDLEAMVLRLLADPPTRAAMGAAAYAAVAARQGAVVETLALVERYLIR
jgi:3-deoxy-D-manno-octulosonic-acid transferase